MTEVVLEFTVQGHRLRLMRTPEYERPKRTGTGATTQRAKASLTWVGAAPSGHSPDGLTRIDEVARTIQRLLGMSAAQFFQVVLLPQGEFARFLRSDTGEREQLLERLFGTQRFADVERWFRDTRQRRWHDVAQGRQRVRELVARVAQAAGQEPPTEDDSSDSVPDAAWLAAVRARLTDEATLAAKNDQQAREIRDLAEVDLRRQRELADRVRRVRTASAALADLADLAEQRRSWTDELAAARRAVPVVTAHAAVRRAAEESQNSRRRDERALAIASALDEDGLDWAAASALPAAEMITLLQNRSSVLRDEAGGLQPILADAELQRVAEAQLAELIEHEQHTVAAVARLTDEVAAIPNQLAAARAELAEAQQAASSLDGLANRAEEATALHKDALRLPTVEQLAHEARTTAATAVDRHQEAREALLDIRQRRLDGMAAELATGLRAGEPCAVCGSAEHPRPAAATDRSVTDADERAATAAEQAAARRRTDTAAVAADAESKLAALLERLAGRTETDLAAARDAASAAFAQATARARSLPVRTRAVAKLEAAADQVRGRLAEAEREQARVAAERESLAGAVAGRAERIAAARGRFPDVVARRAHLLAAAAALDDCAQARAARRSAEAHEAELDAACTAAATAAGFTDVAAALRAARGESVIAELADRLAAADSQEAAARAVLAEPELAGVRPDTVVDVAAAQSLAASAAAEAEAAGLALAEAQRRVHEVASLADRLGRAWQHLAPVEAEYQRLAALSDVINGRGQNARKMSLRSYVLAARLADVAVAATARLRQVSQGRYSFVHSDAAGPRGTRGGLGLDVLDDYSGHVRPAKTLSGGESFLASLSLALGLADVVAAETGGALLDTLFIDEGFGTLDADTLDQVMNTLDELRAGGRVVGLVSHVEELRQRIPVRLRVCKSRGGSTLELVSS
jgi:exonuclease SbcC